MQANFRDVSNISESGRRRLMPVATTTAGWAYASFLGLAASSFLDPAIASGAETQAPAAAVESTTVTVIAGTTLETVLLENVNSSFNTIGETVLLSATENVVVNGHVVVSKGARIKAQVSSVGQRGMMGKGGDLNFSPVSVQAVDGQWVPLDKDQMGGRGAGASVGAIIGIGLFASGKAAFVLRGQTYDVSIRRDTAVDTANPIPQPTLRQPDLQVAATSGELKRVNFSTGKPGDNFVFNIRLTPDIAPLVGTNPDAVQIVSMIGERLDEAISAVSVQRDPKDANLVHATFGWWSVIRYAQPNSTPVVLQCNLSDGRVAQAHVDMIAEWKLK